MKNAEHYSEMQAYLEKLGAAEYRVQCAAHKGKKPCRYNPPEYHRKLVDLLKKNDENGFKALKLEQGYCSALGY